jgi:outer membrane protein
MRLRSLLIAAALALALAPAQAIDLMDVWRGATGQDPEHAAAGAARQAGEAQRLQATALWRPTLVLEAGAARASHETAVRGAQFSAPGFGTSSGVAFDTSVTGGTSTRQALALRQPLFSRERDAQSEQWRIAANAAELAWLAAQRDLIVRTAERYFDAALAEHRLHLLRQQEVAVGNARQEASDRFRLGDRPVTDVHEATAQAEAVKAQRLAAEAHLDLQWARLSDFSGIERGAALALPAATAVVDPGPLSIWIEQALGGHPQVLAAQARARGTEQEVRKSAGAFSPTVDFVAQVGRDRLSGGGDFGHGSNTMAQHALGIQLSLPLYTGGTRSARNSETQALLEKAQAELESARQHATQDVRAAWLELTTGRAKAEALEAARKASDSRLDATQVGLKAGHRTTLDLLNAHNDAVSADLALMQSRTELLKSRLKLAALVGQLGESELRAANESLRTLGR